MRVMLLAYTVAGALVFTSALDVSAQAVKSGGVAKGTIVSGMASNVVDGVGNVLGLCAAKEPKLIITSVCIHGKASAAQCIVKGDLGGGELLEVPPGVTGIHCLDLGPGFAWPDANGNLILTSNSGLCNATVSGVCSKK